MSNYKSHCIVVNIIKIEYQYNPYNECKTVQALRAPTSTSHLGPNTGLM